MNNMQKNYVVAVCFLLSSFLGSVAHAKSNNTNKKKISNIELQRAYQRLVLEGKKQSKVRGATNSAINNNYKLEIPVVRNRILITAKKQLRKKYRWGGATPKRGFDCSGLVQYAYKSGNVKLPRTAAEQYRFTKRISLAHLKAGDLIFFHTRRRSRSRINHVGIYMGGGNFIHAPRRGQRVSIAKLGKYWKRRAVGAGRV